MVASRPFFSVGLFPGSPFEGESLLRIPNLVGLGDFVYPILTNCIPCTMTLFVRSLPFPLNVCNDSRSNCRLVSVGQSVSNYLTLDELGL